MIDGYNLVKEPGLNASALKTVYWYLTGDKRAYLYLNVSVKTKQTQTESE